MINSSLFLYKKKNIFRIPHERFSIISKYKYDHTYNGLKVVMLPISEGHIVKQVGSLVMSHSNFRQRWPHCNIILK